ICKGAPESILAVCDRFTDGDADRPLTPDALAQIDAVFQALSNDGFRALGVAVKPISDRDTIGHGDERAMLFAGFVTFVDPAKPESGDAVRALAADGVRTMILTGDNEGVAAKVCRDIGIDPGKIVLGRDIDQLDD